MEWRVIASAPRNGRHFQLWANKVWLKDESQTYGIWFPCARFDDLKSKMPSIYMYESNKWIKYQATQQKMYRHDFYWMPPVKGPNGELQYDEYDVALIGKD